MQSKTTQSPVQLLVNFGFQVYFTPIPGFFSPFPHGTCSLSVKASVLGLEGGPPFFKQFKRIVLLFNFLILTVNACLIYKYSLLLCTKLEKE